MYGIVYGCFLIYFIIIFLVIVFEIVCVVVFNVLVFFIFWFIVGVWFIIFLFNLGGLLNDVGDFVLCIIVFFFFIIVGFIGFCLGFIIGGFLVENVNYGWCWCYWVIVIWNVVVFLLCFFFMLEILVFVLFKFKVINYWKVIGEYIWRVFIEDESLRKLIVKYL